MGDARRHMEIPEWVRGRLRRPATFWQGQILAIGCVTVGALFHFLLQRLTQGATPFAPFFPAVVLASFCGGAAAGVTTLVLGTLVVVAGGLHIPETVVLPFGRLAVFWCGCGLLIAMLAVIRRLVSAFLASEERSSLLAREMQHRVRNVLTMIIAVSEHTARSAATPDDYRRLFAARLQALARVQQPEGDGSAAPDLRDLLRRGLEPFGAERFELAGPSVAVPADIGLGLALLIHELATNALKHGALSQDPGLVSIGWEREATGSIRLVWREENGPPVCTPTRAGFGTRLMRAALPAGRGEACLSFTPEGVRCTIKFEPA